MYTRSRLAGILGCAALVAMVGCSANSGVTPVAGTTPQQQALRGVPMGPDWIYQDGVLYHTPHYMSTVQAASHVKQDIQLLYGGGSVLLKPKTYLILWGYKTYGDPNGVKPLLHTYLKNMGGSSYTNIYVQYYDKVGSKTNNITNPLRQLAKVWEDDTNPVPQIPTDAQVAAEAAAGVAHFGGTPDLNGSYVVATPHGRSSSGFGTRFCAYHSATSVGGKMISYTNLPYMPDAGASCGSNFIPPPSDESGADEGVTIVEGHEYGESVTDPVPFSGWNSPRGEIGDLCAWTNVQNDPFRTKSYSSQPMFSNATSSCVHSYP
jgi:hypothetical protein